MYIVPTTKGSRGRHRYIKVKVKKISHLWEAVCDNYNISLPGVLILTLLTKLSSAWIVVCFTLHFNLLKIWDILAEWQTAWNLIRCRATWCLVSFQAVCKGLTIMIRRLKVKPYLRFYPFFYLSIFIIN